MNVTDKTDKKEDHRRITMIFWYAALSISLGGFSLMIASDCYFNRNSHTALQWMFFASCIFGMVYYTRILKKKNFTYLDQGEIKKLKAAEIPFSICVIGSMLGSFIWLHAYALMSLLIFLTSHEDIHFTATLHNASQVGRACRHAGFDFYHESIERNIQYCTRRRFNLSASIGDIVIVKAKLGPFGVRFQSIQPKNTINYVERRS